MKFDTSRAGERKIFHYESRDFPTFSKQGPGTNDFGKNNMYISQIGKMDTKQNRG